MVSIIAEASAVTLFAVGGGAALTGVITGALSNAILRDAGFGTIGNGILLVIGAGGGIWAEFAFSGRI